MKKIFFTAGVAIIVALAAVGCKQEIALTKSGLNPADFDSVYDGKKTALYALTNSKGMEVCITNFGGRIVSVIVPDRNERSRMSLGFDKVFDYFRRNYRFRRDRR